MKIGLSSFALKIIAVVSMVLDHTAAVFFPEAMWMRIIGRLSYQIFAFLLVEGVIHTHNIKKYVTRLGILALLSEIPYDLVLSGRVLYVQRQNVFFSLFLAALALALIQKTKSEWKQITVLVGSMAVANIIRAEYSWVGLFMMFLLWYLRAKSRIWKCAIIAVVNIFIWGGNQLYALPSLIPIALYNGKEGKKCQFFFYSFYPLHLFVIWMIQLLL